MSPELSQAVQRVSRAGPKAWAALAVLTLAVWLLAIDGTVLGLAVPALTVTLGPTATQLLWIGDVYSFVLAGLLVTMGNLADRVGRKRLLLFGTVAFGLSSVIAAFSPTPELLIAARALLGISGATIMPSTLSILRNLFPDDRQRTLAIAIWAAGATGGAALGPLVGGVLLEHFWWGSVFLINVPIMIVVFIGGMILLPETRNAKPGPFDFLSAALSIATIVPVVYAIKHAVSEGIDATFTITLLMAIVGATLFITRQRRVSQPLLDLELFQTPAFAGAVATNTVATFALSGLLFFFSQYLQLVLGYGPLQAGVAQMPTAVSAIAATALVGVVLAKLGRGCGIAAGLGLGAFGFFALAAAEASAHFFWTALALALVGLGLGIGMTLSTDAVVSSVPQERAGAASAISETSYELGVALGIALLGTLQTALYRAYLVVPLDTPEEARRASEDSLTGASRILELDSPLLESARHAFTAGMQLTSIAAGALALVAAFIAWRTIPAGLPSSGTQT